jgi:membrane protease YdiL (CAAX protease family)
MHLGYSGVGLLEVFIIGLYFCWLMWRFGNLWLTIILHGLYNGLQMLILMLIPLPGAG